MKIQIGRIVLLVFGLIVALNLRAMDVPKSNGLYFDNESEQYFVNKNVKFSIRPTGNAKYLEKIEVSVNGGAYSPYSGKISLEKDGLNEIKFRSVDSVLNWSPVQSYRIFVDNNKPNTKIFWEGDVYKRENVYYINDKTRLHFQSQDDLAGIAATYYSYGEEGKVNHYGNKLTFGKDGKYVMKYASQDNVGNLGDWQSVEFFVDKYAPKTEVEIVGAHYKSKSKYYFNKSSYISLKATDDHSGVASIEYKIGDGPVRQYLDRIILDNKISNVSYRSVDKVGNSGNWENLEIYLDAIPPEIQVGKNGRHVESSGKIYVGKGFALTFSANDGQSGVKDFHVETKGALQPIKGQNQVTFNEPGEYQIQLSALDNVGNSSLIVDKTIVVDNQAPESAYIAQKNLVQKEGVWLSSLPNRIMFEAKDSGVGSNYIEYSYDGQNYQKYNDAIDLATWKTTNKTIYYRAVDLIGNVEPAKKIQVEILKQGPSVELFVEHDNLPEVPLSKIINMKSKDRNIASEK